MNKIEIANLIDALVLQTQKVKDSNYNIKEVKKLEKLDRQAMKLGLAKRLGSAWYKDKLPKSLHKKYKDAGFSFF